MSLTQAIILAIIEGLTEFLPVSSTGHIIIGSSVMSISALPFTKVFTVAIQFGAIVSVLVLYWKKFIQSLYFYLQLTVAFIPSALIGLIFDDYIDALLERVEVVGFMLIIGGIIFLFIDRLFKENETNCNQRITPLIALKIGFFQCIAMIPGVSRSAATIIGGMTQKLNRQTAAEFSFFLAVPTMLAATLFKLYGFVQEQNKFSNHEILLLVIGNIVAFVVAIIAIKSFIQFLTKHGFKFFGYYRIVVGTILVILYYLGIDLKII
jgi:undecaprenyl-diphosphatase